MHAFVPGAGVGPTGLAGRGLPPDLEGTFLRIGPGHAESGTAGALHAVEFQEGRAVSYLTQPTTAYANLFWHAGAILALPESGYRSNTTWPGA